MMARLGIENASHHTLRHIGLTGVIKTPRFLVVSVAFTSTSVAKLKTKPQIGTCGIVNKSWVKRVSEIETLSAAWIHKNM